MARVEAFKTKKDLEKMKKELEKVDPKFRLLFVFGLNSALRISDIVGLKVKDVMKNGQPKKRVSLREEKTDKIKEFPLNKSIIHELKHFKNADPEDYLFPSQKGGHLCTRYASRTIKKVAKQIGIEGNFGSHSMRKSFGYTQLKNGTPLAIIMQLLNHSSEKDTLRYVGITQEVLDEAYMNVIL
ncbi:tyrosine-type recombinase/integrase [Thermoactinomyces sp. DSM 45892]|uniref:tyrosine-type recombinase/integrase n=1 Tax=Thermoactinomyces sp. DSM 45892 TaxID=1882753 RepID=UPI0008968BB2|nr:tyrosine-type recombinase/integrase [Thermoactinomyces sp. DSM 45892]SDZ04925.1 Phage integrase family protein [Thermoactinomyces sp. DSM 45892]